MCCADMIPARLVIGKNGTIDWRREAGLGGPAADATLSRASRSHAGLRVQRYIPSLRRFICAVACGAPES
jgi:hypothetical protein